MIKINQQYTDIPFFISRNPFTGDLNLIHDVSAIRQAIKNALLTNAGERSFDYNFGASLYATLFENVNLELILDIQSRIANNLRGYESRVNINDIRVIDNPGSNSINIVVDFGIPDLQIDDVIEIDIARTR